MPNPAPSRGPRPLLGLTMRVVILLALAPLAWFNGRQYDDGAAFPFTLAAFAGALAAGLVAGYVWDDEGVPRSRERRLRAIAMGLVFVVIQGTGVLVGPSTSLPIAGAATVAMMLLVGWILFGGSRDDSDGARRGGRHPSTRATTGRRSGKTDRRPPRSGGSAGKTRGGTADGPAQR